jgi:hypothetical protein
MITKFTLLLESKFHQKYFIILIVKHIMNVHAKYCFALVISLSIIAILGTMSLKEFQVQHAFGQSNSSNITDNNIIRDNLNEFEEDKNEIVGLVEKGNFIDADSKKILKLTRAHIVEAITPEAKQIDLTDYEGKAILVSFQQIDDEWIWAAAITDVADPILTKVIKKVFEIQ